MTATDNILELTNLNKSFRQGDAKITILNDADLAIRRGEIVALIGPSGSGKSTLLYISALLDRADGGKIVIDGEDCGRMSDNARTNLRCKKIGFVYQNHNLFADFSALENVMIPMLAAGTRKSEAIARAASLLKKMGLESRAAHRPAEMSGGEQQRVAIARALANNPPMLFADEPTGNLDPVNSESVFGQLLDLARKEKMTALVATHNPALAAKMHRQVALVDGKLLDIGDRKNRAAMKASKTGRKILESFG
jgi:lipoprotein-releasing system ATP-binding protein